MNYKKDIPIVMYDNQCYLCVKFSKMINFFARGKIAMIGHYTRQGQLIREKILDDSALEMFWFINEKNAFGGRAALLPMIKEMIRSKNKSFNTINFDEDCNQECKTVKAVILRSASLMFNSRKIELEKSK